jgi:hypothetical protein
MSDDIELPDGPLHFVSASMAVPQFTTEELAQIVRSMKASIELLKGTKYAHRVPSLKAIEVKAASLAFMEVSRDA